MPTNALPRPARGVLLLDVLHYLGPREQEELLRRIAATLEPGGALLVREADAGAGLRFLSIRIGERLSSLLRGRWRQSFHYRSVRGWTAILTALGLAVERQDMGMGTPYANVLLRAVQPAPAQEETAALAPGLRAKR